MKKKILYILILIVLTVTLSPILKVQAEIPYSPFPTTQPTPPPTTTPVNPAEEPPANTNTPYKFLAPLPNMEATFDSTSKTALGTYLNKMIELIIGISGVLAVVMIVMGGIEYMGSELISSKEEGKSKIQNALFGLLIALCAWALLNTINPDLLKSNEIKDATVSVTIESFKISGAQTRTGQPGTPVSFKQEACPVAQIAQTATGVDKALVLAVFAQETASGANTGSCTPDNANMRPEDRAALATIVGTNNVTTTHVSCAYGGGHGGAIGLMQFLPTTWIETVGASKDPWKTDDALMAAAVYLKKLGGITDPRNAACKYYSGVACQPGRNPPNEFYGDQVMTKMASISQQIASGGCNTGGASGSW
jgi:hypothetical protein